jgi:hypothetical protein
MEQAASSPIAIQPLTGSSGVAALRTPKAAFRRNGVVPGRPPAYSARVEARRTPMKRTYRLAVFAFAVALNGAAVAALHVAMVDGARSALAANQEVEHVVVSATPTPAPVATSNCPTTPKAL